MIKQEVQGYFDEIRQWQQTMESNLRASDGWLALVGLEWLHEGSNTIGSALDNDIVLPEAAPAKLARIEFFHDEAKIWIETDTAVTVDDAHVKSAILRPDFAEGGPSFVKVGSVKFFLIKRGNQYGIRILDTKSAALETFSGRNWFPIDSSYKVLAQFSPHESTRTMQVINSIGMTVPMENPGYLEFELHDKQLRLEAFQAGEGQLWIIFKDGTSGSSSYGAGRFLYAKFQADGQVLIDFNRAYHPPCAFTHYATCPLAPKENVLNIPIHAGECF